MKSMKEWVRRSILRFAVSSLLQSKSVLQLTNGEAGRFMGKVSYHCGSAETCKAGIVRGKQRYYCRTCRSFFRENRVLAEGKTDYKKLVGKLPRLPGT